MLDRTGWFRRYSLLALLSVIVLVWLAKYVVPKYYRLDRDDIGVFLIKGNTWHYPVLVIHVLFASVAMLTGCLQMWGWLRRTRPDLHRITGRVYVGSVFLAAPAAFGLVLFALHRDGDRIGTYLSSFAIGSLVWATLWFGVTVRGFQMALQRRWVEHRRMMIYSFALTLAIMEGRPLNTLAVKNTFSQWNLTAFFELMGWMPWVLHLLVAQWWLNRTARRPLVLPAVLPGQPNPAGAIEQPAAPARVR
jgi:drug/metabolite transporter superfamily protein YnfA